MSLLSLPIAPTFVPVFAANEYLRTLLDREAVDTSESSPVRTVRCRLLPILRQWAGGDLLDVIPSGSFAKGTAIRSGTHIDLFVSLSPDMTRPLREIHDTLFEVLTQAGLTPRRQNVSLNIRLAGYSVDLVPALRHNMMFDDHSLYLRKFDTWTKTNVLAHIAWVRAYGLPRETRILKLWRNQRKLDFPSFYLEMVVARALRLQTTVNLSDNVLTVFHYLADQFLTTRYVDPSNGENVLSDQLTYDEKSAIGAAAIAALAAPRWSHIVQ